jgi:hypothetical protein
VAPALTRAARRADLAWSRLVALEARRPAALVVMAFLLALAVRLAAAPFGTPANVDVFAYALKAREIAQGDLTPIRTHAIGWSLVLAPVVALVPGAPMLQVLDLVRLVAGVLGAAAVVPFAALARRALDPPARLAALLLFPFALLPVRMAVRGFAEPLFTLLLLGALAGALGGARGRVVGAAAAGFAWVTHPTGVAVPVITAVVTAMAAPRGMRLGRATLVLAIALAVAAPAAGQRARAFDGPMDYGFNTRFFVEHRQDVTSASLEPPTLVEYVAATPPARILDRLVVRGAGAVAWDLAVDVLHLHVVPFLAVGCWLAVGTGTLRAVLVAAGLFVASWVPVYELFGTGRHLAPVVPLALLLGAAGLVAFASRARHPGAWVLAALVAFAAAESTVAAVQRHRALHDETADGLVWARWVAANVRGRLALARGHELVMLHLPDATIGGLDILSMSAPRTGLALVRPGHFPTTEAAFAWLRANGVTHLLVDGLRDAPSWHAPLLTAPSPPPGLADRYATPPGSRWPVRVFEVR